MIGHCQHCNQSVDIFSTSKRCDGSGLLEEMKQGPKPFEVNIRMVSFVRDIGMGQACWTSFSQHLNVIEGLGSSCAYGNLFNYHSSAMKQIALTRNFHQLC